MSSHAPFPMRPLAAIITGATMLALAPNSEARVTRIVIDSRSQNTQPSGRTPPLPAYEQITGRAFGELDPDDSHNALITDIGLAPRNANGKVEYVATFVI